MKVQQTGTSVTIAWQRYMHLIALHCTALTLVYPSTAFPPASTQWSTRAGLAWMHRTGRTAVALASVEYTWTGRSPIPLASR